MAFPELHAQNATEISEVLQYPSTVYGSFWPMILISIFMIITMASFFRQLRREGKADFMSSLAIGGFVTTSIAVAFTLLGLINNITMVVVLVVGIVFIVLNLLTTKDN